MKKPGNIQMEVDGVRCSWMYQITPWLMEPGGSMPHTQGLSNNPILSRINPIPALIPISSKSILILSSHLRLDLPKSLFPEGLRVKILKALLPSSILATWPAHLNLLDLITLTILDERCKLWSSSLKSLLHSPFSSFLGANARLRILFLNSLSLHSTLNVRDHVSQLYITTLKPWQFIHIRAISRTTSFLMRVRETYWLNAPGSQKLCLNRMPED